MRRIAAVAIAVCFVAVIAFAHHGPESVTINAAASKQPGVVFPHAKHMTAVAKCETCHHTDKGLTKDTDKDVKKCSACHLNPKDANVPNMADMSMSKNPFHVRCVGCHKAEKKGPTLCKDCHKK